MHNRICFVFILLFIYSCKEPKKQGPKADTYHNINEPAIDKSQNGRPGWPDSLISDYIKNTDDKIIKLNRKDSTRFTWTLDSKETTDTATYYVFQVSHSFENKLITDKWLYIDSVTRVIFEYDLPNDKLLKWSK
jgi:hypothetical protein